MPRRSSFREPSRSLCPCLVVFKTPFRAQRNELRPSASLADSGRSPVVLSRRQDTACHLWRPAGRQSTYAGKPPKIGEPCHVVVSLPPRPFRPDRQGHPGALASSILLFQSGGRVSPRGRLGAVTTQLMLNRHPRLLFFGSAALTAVVFLVALHPATGVLGGLIYLLTARALPTIMVVALALGFAWLLPVRLAVRIAVALPLSFLLGLNTALPVLLDLVRYSPAVSYEVRRAAVWSAERHPVVNVKKRRWGPIFVVPFGPRVRVAGDEGCGCMYFLDAAQALYSDRVIATLFDAVGERGGVTDYMGSTTERMDVHIELTVWKEPDGYRALVECFDHGEKIAAFAQRRIL